MTEVETILRATASILVVDWLTKALPETLARAGYKVVVKSGPRPDDYVEYATQGDGSIRRLPTGRPEHIDVVHVFRPIEELPVFVGLAGELGATTVWVLSGLADDGTRDADGCWLPADRSDEARRIVESAGMTYVQRPTILEAVRAAGVVGTGR
jgi:predicted CoA-binding protein